MKNGTAAAILTAFRVKTFPIGARILSVVDCLDALATDRQYRRALPLDEAMKVVIAESGKAFDPKVVDVLVARYVELEQLAQGKERCKGKLIGGRENREWRIAGGRIRSVREGLRGTENQGGNGGLPHLHRRGPPGSAGAVRNFAGPGQLA